MKHEDINYKVLEDYCLASIQSFAKMKSVTWVKDTAHGPLIYIDRGSKILAVAHLDSVQDTQHFFHVTIQERLELAQWVYNAQLDDRLGAYVITHLLPTLGINTDVLLTYGEETGNSTAQFFEAEKKYKWMFQFDRNGEDLVTYQYGSKFLKERLRKSGFNNIGHGSFSDICYLEHLGCEGFNVACGYTREHSVWAKADMNALTRQVTKFQKFFDKYKTLSFPHNPKPYVEHKKWKGHYMGMDEWDDGWSPHGYTPDFYAKATSGTVTLPPEGNTHNPAKQLPAKTVDPCIMCMRPLWRADKEGDVKFEGICKACSEQSDLCIGCGFIFYTSTLDEQYLCKQCHTSALVGDILTMLECPICHSRVMLSDVGKEMCYTCKVDKDTDIFMHMM